MNTTNIMTRQIKYDPDQMVVMANDMVRGTSNLSLNEAKLLRLIIMQVKPDDTNFEPFTIKIDEFADFLGVDRHNVYKEADRMTDHLMTELIRIGDGNPRHKWRKFHWVSNCDYENGILTIRLSDDLKPYILNLKKWYTQYRLEDILRFRSTFAIKLYELLISFMVGVKPYAGHIREIYIDIDTIRKATNTENKFDRISQFKEKVIGISVREINEKSGYHVQVRDEKIGRKIVGFYFTIQSNTNYNLYGEVKPEINDSEQFNLEDYMEFEA